MQEGAAPHGEGYHEKITPHCSHAVLGVRTRLPAQAL
jgi:hypothetical protein